jgi:hypothetical protein
MEPPWVKYPEISAGSIGWRMGRGEEYLYEFIRWFSSLTAEEQSRFAQGNPPPQSWRTLSIFRVDPWPKPDMLHRLLAVRTGTIVLVGIAVAAGIVMAVVTFG